MVLGLVMVFGIIGIGIFWYWYWYWYLVFWYHCGGVYVRKKRCHWTAASERERERDGDKESANEIEKETGSFV